ncbi:MAG: class I SAM-dependent methyltransferase [Allorhizobium sp.]
MAKAEDRSLAFYSANAQTYAARGRLPNLARLEAFLKQLPSGGRILELGCGDGKDSEAILARGFSVVPTDGSAEMALEAERRLGRPVRTMRFEELEDVGAYDGVWANACLLHVPRGDLTAILGRIFRAVREPAVFYASFKAGENEGNDRFGRYYNRPTVQWLTEAYHAAGWRAFDIEETSGGGYDGEPTDWLHVTAIRAG